VAEIEVIEANDTLTHVALRGTLDLAGVGKGTGSPGSKERRLLIPQLLTDDHDTGGRRLVSGGVDRDDGEDVFAALRGVQDGSANAGGGMV